MRQTAAITGGSSGFGSILALAFARSGFDLVLCGRGRRRLDRVQDAVRHATSRSCATLAIDLLTPAGRDAFAEALQRHRADIVVNNAAINPELVRGENPTAFGDIIDIIATNASAAIAVCLAAFAHFDTRGRGVIINVNSMAGLRGSGHEPIYAASKFALRGFSESVKDAWLARGVRMIDVNPGAIATGMSAGRPDAADLIDPEELAAFLVHLCRTHTFYTREINIQKTPVAVRRTRRVVFANGIFDLLHPGHLALLKFAKSLGDKLVVGVNSDRTARLLKGPDRPVCDEHARKAALESLRFVDEVVVFDDVRTTETVRSLMPDVIVKGDDYTVEAIRKTDKIPESIEIVTFPVLCDANGVRLSTTATIARLAAGGD